jgi:hypothetical protein
MASSMIDVVPQPRIDTLVIDAATGTQRRRTEYSGTVWFGGRPQVTSYGTITTTRHAVIESPFFLPDSLPYRPDPLDDAVVVRSPSRGETGHQLPTTGRARARPRNPRTIAACRAR